MSVLQLELLKHIRVNVAPQSERHSEIVRAAVSILTTKQAAGKLLTVKELISKYHQSVKSSLDSIDAGKQDAGSIPYEPLVLLGRLSPDVGRGDLYSGEIIFSDGTSSIVCELGDSVSLDCVGQIVLLFNWNYILSEPVPLDIISAYQRNLTTEHNQLVYLEISECYVVDDGIRVPAALPDVVHSVSLLERWMGEQSLSVKELNVYGRLVANSLLYKPTKTDRVFMVQLTDNHSHHSCHIIIQERHLLHFANLLIIGRIYLFSNVRVKNMIYTKQEVKVERRVLSTSANSGILEYIDYSDGHKTGMSSTSSATSTDKSSGTSIGSTRKRGYSDDGDGQPKKLLLETSSDEGHSVASNVRKQEGQVEMMTSPIVGYDPSSVVSYTGVITKCVLPEAGIYELDSKVQLFLTHKPCMNLCRGLRVGATVQLDNIHPTKLTRKKVESLFAFCCCSRSSIKVVNFSSLNTPYEPFVSRKSFIASYGRSLSLDKFQWVLEVYLSLKDKLSLLDGHCRNSHVRKVFVALYKDSGLVGSKRDIYEEYLAIPHHCPSTMTVAPKSCSHSEWRLYTIKELLTALQKKVVEEASVVFKTGDCLPSYKEKLRTTQGTHVSWSYGIINYNKFDPPIMLVGVVQGSGSTGQLILQDSTGEINVLLCTSYCDEHSITEKKWTIANIAKLFRQSVIIRKWYVVIERISNSKKSLSDVSDSLYIVCCEEDVFVASIPQKLLPSSSSHKLVYISEIYKQPLMLRCDRSSTSLNYTIECSVHSSIQSLHASKKLANKAHFNCKGNQLCLYPFLQYNCVYETLSKETVLLTNISFVEGDPKVHGDIAEVTDLVSSYNLRVNSEKMNIRIVNFTGVLINRKFCCKQDLHIPAKYSDLPGIKEGQLVCINELGCGPISKDTLSHQGINPIYSQVKVVLEIEGRCFPDTLLVYYDLTLIPQPVGLIPGALLLFTHFQLTCNYGRISCSSSALSKVQVLSIDYKLPHLKPGSNSEKEQAHKSGTASLFITDGNDVSFKVTAMHTSLLSVLINKLLGGILTHACVKLRCVIITILWVRIQYKCLTCDKLIISNKCETYCSLQQPKFLADCKLIISDGSGEALLYCYDSLVPTALACNINEWQNIEGKTKVFGEMTYQKPKKSFGGAIQTHYGRSSTEEASANLLLASISSKQTVSRNVVVCATPFLTAAEAFTPGTRTRPIYVNKMCHDTLVLPRIQLRAMAVAPVDCLMESRRLLQQLEQHTV